MRKEPPCIEQISKYSPILEESPITFSTITFNGSLFKQNVYRQPAGPEVDAAWEALGVDYRAAIIPSSLASKSNLSPSHVQINPKYVPGGAYLANVEGLHHLHCLNLLRKSLYYNFEYYAARKEGAFKNDKWVLEAHVSHCLDTLRQQLQCTVDIGMLGQIWWDTPPPSSSPSSSSPSSSSSSSNQPSEKEEQSYPHAFPDFNTAHTCRNFETVRRWAEKNQAPRPEDTPDDYLVMPRGEDVLGEVP